MGIEVWIARHRDLLVLAWDCTWARMYPAVVSVGPDPETENTARLSKINQSTKSLTKSRVVT